MKLEMKNFPAILLVLVFAGFAQAKYMEITPGTVILDENFDSGTFVEGPLVHPTDGGQAASNGDIWRKAWWGGNLKDTANVGTLPDGDMAATYFAGDYEQHRNRLDLALGQFLGDNLKIKFEADLKAAEAESMSRFFIEINGGFLLESELKRGYWTNGDDRMQKLSMGKNFYSANEGSPYGPMLSTPYLFQDRDDPTYDDGYWWHVEMVTEGAYYGDDLTYDAGGDHYGSRDAGDEIVTLSYVKYGPEGIAGSGSYSNVDEGGTWMRPIGVQIAFDDYGTIDAKDGHSTILGVDNIKVTVLDTTYIPEPTSLAMLSLGGLMMLRRRRAA